MDLQRDKAQYEYFEDLLVVYEKIQTSYAILKVSNMDSLLPVSSNQQARLSF